MRNSGLYAEGLVMLFGIENAAGLLGVAGCLGFPFLGPAFLLFSPSSSSSSFSGGRPGLLFFPSLGLPSDLAVDEAGPAVHARVACCSPLLFSSALSALSARVGSRSRSRSLPLSFSLFCVRCPPKKPKKITSHDVLEPSHKHSWHHVMCF